MFQATLIFSVLLGGTTGFESQIVPAKQMQTMGYVYESIERCLQASQERVREYWDVIDDRMKTDGIGVLTHVTITCLQEPLEL